MSQQTQMYNITEIYESYISYVVIKWNITDNTI